MIKVTILCSICAIVTVGLALPGTVFTRMGIDEIHTVVNLDYNERGIHEVRG
jgi:hypothetical protein